MERPRRGCVNLPYLAGTKKRPVKKGPYKLISPSKYKHSCFQSLLLLFTFERENSNPNLDLAALYAKSFSWGGLATEFLTTHLITNRGKLFKLFALSTLYR